jgi:hypothetical protein
MDDERLDIVEEEEETTSLEKQPLSSTQQYKSEEKTTSLGNMSRFKDTSVTLIDTEYCVFPPDKRTPENKVKIMKMATEALPATFKEISYAFEGESSDALLTAGYNMYMRSGDVYKRLVKFGMNEVFMIPPNGDDWAKMNSSSLATIMGTRRKLTEEWHTLTEAQVRSSTVFYQLRGQDYDKENLHWSLDLLEKSCDPELREKVTELCDDAEPQERGGPLFYWHLMHCLSTCTEEASRMLCKVVRELDPRKIPGEDINKACSMIRGALVRLKVAGPAGTSIIPTDIVATLIEVFQRTSVTQFNGMFSTLQFNRNLGILGTHVVDVKYILKLAETKYTELKGTSAWTGAGLPDSAFPTQDGEQRTCWNCNQPGHIASACPTRTRNGGPGRGNVRGGRGGRGPVWRRVAPGNGEPLTKQEGDLTYKWCATCKIWQTGTKMHSTEEHRRGGVANVAEGITGGTTTPVTDPASPPPTGTDSVTWAANLAASMRTQGE